MKTLVIALVLLNVAYLASSANWAVLVAGSNGFYNYRHQTDICHAYHILIGNGYKPENVIVFSYNDVASSEENPFPNKLYNKPVKSKTDPAIDVNEGCKIDYEGDDNNPSNFLAVLRGDATAVTGGNGRVLQSTADDKVFINFADHGATGLIAFPNEYLYAADLLTALADMGTSKLYSELVFYLEACESGSMFQNLPKNAKIFATSASSPDESSWAAYCPPDDIIQGVAVGSCLGDLYSINWMEDTDKGNLDESLDKQFQIVKQLTTQSAVMEWGDQSFNNEPIRNFLSGTGSSAVNVSVHAMIKKLLGRKNERLVKNTAKMINSRDVKLNYLMNKYMRTNSLESEQAVQAELKHREQNDKTFEALAINFHRDTEVFTAKVDVKNYDCLKQSVKAHDDICGKFDDYSLKYVRILATLCETGVNSEEIASAFHMICQA